MAVTIKSPEEQQKMRLAGRLAADVLDMIETHVAPGVTTDELDRLCHEGFHGDTSRMYFVGKPPVLAERLARVCCEAMWSGIQVVRPGARLGDIGHAIQSLVEASDFSVVREYCGHGIGRVYHEDPQVLHYGEPGTGPVLRTGMTFTIEPMINAGKRHVQLLKDGWTVVTKDHSLSAQWEHTILVTNDGYEVLTLGAQERARDGTMAA
jgi:methionyl aminopeptidase